MDTVRFKARRASHGSSVFDRGIGVHSADALRTGKAEELVGRAMQQGWSSWRIVGEFVGVSWSRFAGVWSFM